MTDAAYERSRTDFSWEAARGRLEGLPGGRGLNIAHEAVDRHANGPRADHVALRWLGKGGEREDVTYAALAARSNQFARLLESLGVEAGERVFSLIGRVPELYVAVLGTLKRRAVFSPLFSAFGPEPIATRIEQGDGRVLVTTARLYQRKVAALRERLPGLRHVLIVGGGAAKLEGPGLIDLDEALKGQPTDYEIGPTDPEDMALLHFTSGTTGKPKGAVHVHGAVVAHHETAIHALGLGPEATYWCTADPGWVTGTSYGIIAPLTHGLTSVVYEPEFDARAWYEVLARERITVWYTAPTAIRMLMRAGAEARAGVDLSRLAFIASVGEPLNPEAISWAEQVLDQPIHDNWWQTETGGIMIANGPGQPIRKGSMGRPLPGIEAGLVRERDDGALDVIDEAGVEGELALRPGWPSMFRAYLDNEERYRRSFRDGWYLSGDLARRDEDGYYWFVGRADDVIKSAGHLIGPFEVESALIEHPAVVEAAVIGKPDEVAGHVVKAFVALHPGYEVTDELRRDLMAHARKRLGPAVAPREIEIVDGLPRTRSGKIMRRLLKARELGLPEGDTSTLETNA